MDKFAARKKYQTLRFKLSRNKILDLSVKIANKCLDLDIWSNKNFHIFLSLDKKNEVDTKPIIDILDGRQKNIIISKSDFKTFTLKNYLLNEEVILEENKYGIPEPTNGIQINNSIIDVVFVPLLAYDVKGNRVGYGKGFYDMFLQNLDPKTTKIGLSFFSPELSIKNIDEDDVQLDYCVSPEKIFNFL
tara:strand:- start:48 stop:614 length:567 start_codon:yes stop_codon:yes gene_type:complete